MNHVDILKLSNYACSGATLKRTLYSRAGFELKIIRLHVTGEKRMFHSTQKFQMKTWIATGLGLLILLGAVPVSAQGKSGADKIRVLPAAADPPQQVVEEEQRLQRAIPNPPAKSKGVGHKPRTASSDWGSRAVIVVPPRQLVAADWPATTNQVAILKLSNYACSGATLKRTLYSRAGFE